MPTAPDRYLTLQKNSAGFNLLELLISLMIIGILTGLSVPVYSQYIVNQKRMQAAAIISQLAFEMERYYITHQTYQKSSLKELGFTEKIVNGAYQLTILSTTTDHFELAAIPQGNQAQKDLCGTLTLNSLGEKGASGNEKIINCW